MVARVLKIPLGMVLQLQGDTIVDGCHFIHLRKVIEYIE